ncbi:ABC-three component system protein [Calidifontibacillus oryziterrae]|uniref:ABC-three component system protein n=1 Tax=Calidifontibacillus oryziterrae TaxID=1191699 RepID=UPI0002F23F7D|nr:ABC-three component system protein [Calidifontibacillus oryziterrae]
MANVRKIYTQNEQLLLYSQVEGICPLCTKPLYYEKIGKIYKKFELAHIYPLNPNSSEELLLKTEKKLSIDVNSLDNIIPLCLDCHEKFDKPRTVEEYRKLFQIKESLIKKSNIMNSYSLFNIEEEIREVLYRLDLDTGELIRLEYSALKVDEKSDVSLPPLLKKQIKNDIIEYFNFIKDIFKEIDKETPDKFNTLAMQIKGFYFKCKQTTRNQEEIFRSIVDWIHNKTGKYSLRACEIIASFFIQDCEVFS